MTTFPFICLGMGLMVGFQNLSKTFLKAIDGTINVTLMALMLTIGMSIGANNANMDNLHVVGINCLVIALSAISFSVFFTLIVEKTVLPLESIQLQLNASQVSLNDERAMAEDHEEKKSSPVVLIMPFSIVLGVLLGFYAMPKDKLYLLDYLLTASLLVLYVGVGISLGSNRKVFRYIRVLGGRVVYLSFAIFFGSVLGGLVAGFFLNLPPEVAVLSSSGMSYYSLTGAYMTKVYGIEIGTYGFIVNVMREFLTVLLLPILIKISKGSSIAGGAAGNMDTMLMPITKFLGPELGLVTLITGTILTFAVPFILPLLSTLIK